MPSLFSRLKHKDGSKSKKKGADVDSFAAQLPKGPQWTDAWTRTTVEAEEVVELITLSTEELKSRGMTSTWTPGGSLPSLCCTYPLRFAPCACHRIWWLVHFLCIPTVVRSVQLLTSLNEQLSISHFYCSPSDRPPTPAPFAPLCDTFSTNKMADQRSAERHSSRSCA